MISASVLACILSRLPWLAAAPSPATRSWPFNPRVPPTNNLAERALRPLVVLRKITFGHRRDAAAHRMAKLLTVGETARRHGHRPSDIYFELYARPPDRVMRRLDADA